MSNFGIKIDLSKLSGAAVVELTGRSGQPTKCVVIPVEANHIFVGQKGIYLDLCAFEMQNPRFEDTHCIKVQFDKAIYDNMTEEERRAQPIVGGLHELQRRQAAVDLSNAGGNPSFAQTEEDLPF